MRFGIIYTQGNYIFCEWSESSRSVDGVYKKKKNRYCIAHARRQTANRCSRSHLLAAVANICVYQLCRQVCDELPHSGKAGICFGSLSILCIYIHFEQESIASPRVRYGTHIVFQHDRRLWRLPLSRTHICDASSASLSYIAARLFGGRASKLFVSPRGARLNAAAAATHNISRHCRRRARYITNGRGFGVLCVCVWFVWFDDDDDVALNKRKAAHHTQT